MKSLSFLSLIVRHKQRDEGQKKLVTTKDDFTSSKRGKPSTKCEKMVEGKKANIDATKIMNMNAHMFFL